MNETATRPYRSSVREQQARATRQGILAAATKLFVSRGWGGTGMREVAESAGVSVETVYKYFPSKGELLHRVVDVLVAGDDEPVPLAQRAAYRAMETGGLAERARAAAALVTAIHVRQAPILPAMREAASSDETMAALVAELFDQRRLEFRRGGSLVARRQLSLEEADGIWAVLSADAYLLLTGHVGWTDAAYEDWAADCLVALLLAHQRPDQARPEPSGGREE